MSGEPAAGIRTLTESEMFALDLNATALTEESACSAFWLSQEERGFPAFPGSG